MVTIIWASRVARRRIASASLRTFAITVMLRAATGAYARARRLASQLTTTKWALFLFIFRWYLIRMEYVWIFLTVLLKRLLLNRFSDTSALLHWLWSYGIFRFRVGDYWWWAWFIDYYIDDYLVIFTILLPCSQITADYEWRDRYCGYRLLFDGRRLRLRALYICWLAAWQWLHLAY